PLPNRTLQVILQREQRILREGGEYKQSFDLYMEGVKNRITIKKRS
ncbi:dTDP-4-dehydrorhamnose 3,5-epimerase, partial [Anoxybacillus sp. UARK-01]